MHHILHECVVGCPILSSMYDHVPIYLQLHVSSWTVHLHTFLLSLHSNFAPSRPLQLWFEAACETSFAGHIYAMQSTPKSRRGRYSFICLSVFVVLDDGLKTWHVLTEQALWARLLSGRRQRVRIRFLIPNRTS